VSPLLLRSRNPGYLELGMLDAAAQVLREDLRLRTRTATGIGAVFSGLKRGDHLLAQQFSDLNNSLLNQCLHGLVDRLKRTKSRAINQQALRLGDARVGTVGYVIPC
jgi:hypothetical protein